MQIQGPGCINAQQGGLGSRIWSNSSLELVVIVCLVQLVTVANPTQGCELPISATIKLGREPEKNLPWEYSLPTRQFSQGQQDGDKHREK
jgi:hypothetical protein